MARRASGLTSVPRPAPDLGDEREPAREIAPDNPTAGRPAPGTPPDDSPPLGIPTTGRPPDGTAETGHPRGTAGERAGGASRWLGWGAFSGLLAGVAFAALHAWFAAGAGLSASAPLRTAATIVEGPPPAEAVAGVGVVVHVVLSALFGLVFAALLLPLRRRSAGWLAWAGLLFGGAVYLVGFQVVARSVPWFSAFQATNQPLELAAHLVFGSVLAALLLLAKPRGTTSGRVR